jgi:hypothetical protein
MATLVSKGTGNWSTAGTWEVADTTFELDNAESATQTVATAASWTSGATLTPGVITATSIGVKVSSKGATGTFSVRLYNVSLGAAVAGTTVTVNVTDLPSYGWVKLTFAAPVLLLVATNYRVEAQSSSAGQVVLYRDGTANNFYRFVTTSTTGAPAASNRFYILGDWTAAATSSAYTVTFDETSGTPTDYGSASTTVASMNVGSKGTFASGNTASTNYWMKFSGLWHTTGDGTTQFNTGNGSTRSSTSPTFKLQFDNAAPSDFGFSVKGATNAVWNAQGATMTPYTTLEANIVATNTVITVASTTGWLANDRVVIAPGRRTITEYEDRVIASVDSATQITLTAGVTYPHYGTAPYKCHIMNITRNVQVYGASKTNATWVDMQNISTVDVDYAEFYNMGLAANRGFQMQTTTGSSNAQYSSFHESNEIMVITNSSASTNNNVTFSNNVLFDCATNGINMAVVPTNNNFTYDNNFGIKALFSFSATRGSVSGNISTGNSTGIVFGDTDVTAANFGTCNGNVAYGNTTGISLSAQGFGTFGSIDAHFNASIGLVVNGTKEITIDTPVIYGNGTVNIDVGNQNNAIFLSPTVSGFNDGTNNFSVATGLRYGATTHLSQIVIKNGVFSNVTGVYTAHTSQDINAITRPYMMQLVLENTYLGAVNEFVASAAMSQNSFISSSRHDQTAGSHKAWVREGILSIDTTANMYDVTPSLRMTPSIATYRMKSYVGGSEGLYSIGKWKVAVASGQTATVTVKVRESVAGDGTDYNGQRARLMVEANTIAGITSDTVLATATAASEGAFETLSGVTAAVSGDTVLSFYVDCGYTGYTGGWVNVDTLTATATDSKGLKYWVDGMPYVVGNNVDAGGGTGSSGFFIQ